MRLRDRVARALKAWVVGNSRLYETVRRRRARLQETAYVSLRDSYYLQGADRSTRTGDLSPSSSLLSARWKGPRVVRDRLKDVRIFVALADDPGGPQMLGTFSRHFDAVLFDLASYRTPYRPETTSSLAWRERLQDDLVDAFHQAHRRAPFDLVLAYGSRLEFEPSTLRKLGEGAPVAVMSLDDKHTFDENPAYGYPNGQRPLIGAADVHLTNSRECVRWYEAESAAAYYMPQGIDTELYQPIEVEEDIDVSFMGQRYGFRGRFIDALRASGIRVSCYGPGWGTSEVSEEEKREIYCRSRINLGLGGVAYSDRITCIKGRDFEVPAVAGFYLTTYEPELTQLFDLGREIVCYRSEIDCVELIRYYLEQPEERRAIGQAGRARCLKDHSWERRFDGLLRWMGILAPTARVERAVELSGGAERL